MIFYDFEVFKYDWLVVFIDMKAQHETVIVNSKDELEKFYAEHKNDIWTGFNSRHYDQYILKGILCGFDPKEVNDWIIVRDKPGWQFSSAFREIRLNNYDVMQNIDRGLKTFEGFMGNDIRESSVPFNIDRKLTQAEIEETIKYCRHDVEQTIEVFLRRKADFEAQFGLLQMYKMPLSNISKTKVQLAAEILEARKQSYNDEFEISFPDTLRIKKYSAVVDWYKDKANRKYRIDPENEKSKKHQCSIDVAGVPHIFGWGGVHGAREKYSGEGYYLNMDVASLYPSLMIRYNLHSRSCNPSKFVEIRDLRIKYKHEKNPLQAALKLVLNGTYGAMKDANNPLYDPLMANNVCVFGQLLLLDLIEHLEPYCEIIQSNTDGVLIKLPNGSDEAFYKIDDIAHEWEQRTGLVLEFDEYRKVFQKDVNNYVIVDADGKFKSKGAYVKKLSELDYDLPIVNKAMVDFMVKGIPVEKTILNCDCLKDFQQVKKISSKYECLVHGDIDSGIPLKEKCVRVFASKYHSRGGLYKIHGTTGRPAKVENTPEHCFMVNHSVNGVKTNDFFELDKFWYVDLALKRLVDFGVI